MELPNKEDIVAPELYFLIAKFLSAGPLKETTKVLKKELENLRVLPKRLDWLGNFHDQSYEELCERYGELPAKHLLDVCKAMLGSGQPRKSLLSRRLVDSSHGRKLNFDSIIGRIFSRESGLGPLSPRTPPSLLSHRMFSNFRLQRRTLGHLSAVYCVLYDKGGEYIITGADDLLVKVWSARDGRLLATLRGASSEITDLAVSPDNRLLAAGSLDKLLRVWDLTSTAPVAVLQGHGGMITSVNFCPAKAGDLRCLASTSTDGSVAFWTYQQCGASGIPNFCPSPVQFMERMRPGACHMICCCWSAGGAFLASGSADHHVRLYMMAEGGPRRVLEVAAHRDAVDSLAWAHRGLRLLSGSKDGLAIVWTLHATQWRRTLLNMNSDLLDDVKKVKVTMVCWDCADAYILTAVSDHTIRVWCARTYTQIRVLSGHTGEAYVLEAHPFLSRVALSAGHDGVVFIWDIEESKPLTRYENDITGQDPAAVFDAKWASDGVTAAATDAHGHLLMWGFGQGDPLLEQLPAELFFHTDYRPLTRDATGFVLDEQTGVPPHELPPAFLVDVEGSPHPPSLQRLVPGRERAEYIQLVPETANEVNGELRSQLDLMIAALVNQLENAENQQRMRDNGEERGPGVRHTTGLWQRGEPLTRAVSSLVRPRAHYHTEELLELEMSWYTREMRRRPLMISTSNPTTVATPNATRGRRRRRPPREHHVADAVRSVQRHDEQTYGDLYGDEEDEESEVDSVKSTSDSSVRLSEEHWSSDVSQKRTVREKKRRASSSSDYSDWVADARTVSLQPPTRARRRRVPRKTYTPEVPDEEPLPPDKDQVFVTVKPKKVIPVELPEIYRPSEWLCAVVPRKAPYHPQMGDECLYFKLGHQRYFEAVTQKEIYAVNPKDMPWERSRINDCEHVKVVGIKYIIKPPRLVCLRLSVLPSGTRSFTVRYHDMPDVIDFLVLKQQYDVALSRKWKTDDRFRCMIDDNWWTGTIIACETDSSDPKPGTSSEVSIPNDLDARHFLGLTVRWDNNEQERMSPWDLEPIDENRLPTEKAGCVPVLASEVEAVLYRPQAGEWPHDTRERATPHILAALDQVMALSIAEPFVAPVDLNAYPSYAYVVEYPIDLSTIRARFENLFYRRAAAAQFDVRYLATNAEKFNQAHSPIVRQARLVTDTLLHIISHWWEVDVSAVYRQLLDAYKSSDSDTPLRNGTMNQTNWHDQCSEILKELLNSENSPAFSQPVSLDQAPDYLNIVTSPMDLGTVKHRLECHHYKSSVEFFTDVNLVFNNSLLYNTNRRSRIYSMTVRLRNLFENLWDKAIGDFKTRRRKKRRPNTYSDYATSDEETLAATSRKEAHSKKGKGKGKKSSLSIREPNQVYEQESIVPEVLEPKEWRIEDRSALASQGSSLTYDNLEVLEEEVVDEEVEVTYDHGGESSGHGTSESKRRDRHKARHHHRRKRQRGESEGSEFKLEDEFVEKRRKHKKTRRRRESTKDVRDSSSGSSHSDETADLGRNRYESDHSYKPKVDSEDDVPLNELRQTDKSADGAGPSNPRKKVRKKRGRRAGRHVRYNEDSEEDSIAAISKRLHGHRTRTAVLSRGHTVNIRNTMHNYVVTNGHGGRQNGETSELQLEPVMSVSSRGRVRKPTAKVRGFD